MLRKPRMTPALHLLAFSLLCTSTAVLIAQLGPPDVLRSWVLGQAQDGVFLGLIGTAVVFLLVLAWAILVLAVLKICDLISGYLASFMTKTAR